MMKQHEQTDLLNDTHIHVYYLTEKYEAFSCYRVYYCLKIDSKEKEVLQMNFRASKEPTTPIVLELFMDWLNSKKVRTTDRDNLKMKSQLTLYYNLGLQSRFGTEILLPEDFI